MTRVAVVGYSSLDYSMTVTAFQGVGRTSLISRRVEQPEAGGIARVFAGLAEHETFAISWVGEDRESSTWIQALASRNVDASAVMRLPGGMPTSFLFHAESGETMCFFDDGVAHESGQVISTAGVDLLKSADAVILLVSPADACEAVLKSMAAEARLIWIVKADPMAFPLDLRRQIIQRSSVILHSHQEDAFVREAWIAPFTGVVVRTAGSNSIHWTQAEEGGEVPLDSVVTDADATGAGDWFAGFFVGEWLAGAPVRDAIRIAATASHNYLQQRKREGTRR